MSQNKVAFITGGNRGLGLETARELGEQGVTVVLGVRDLAKGESAAETLRAKGIDAQVISYNGADPSSDKAAYDYFESKYGHLDILVNNAGVFLEVLGGPNNAATVTSEELRGTFDTNFFAVISLTQTLLPLILKAPAGRIVNLSSILGSLTLHADPESPIYNMKALAYDASKAALNSFTVHLAAALQGTPAKVNSAHPGWVKTDMGGPNAMMELSEGGKTSAELALIGEDGPNGGFFHLGQPLPW